MKDENDSYQTAKHIGRWIAAGALGVIPLYMLAVRPWHLRWGATDEEVERPLPGDGICENPHLDSTRAVTVHAQPEHIWPWLVQMGRGRAGWYSYDFIDNPGRRSAEKILPEFQKLEPGDYIPTGIGPGFRVVDVESNQFLVLQVAPQGSLTLALHPQGPSETRLVTRIRVRWNLRDPKTAVMAAVVDPGDFVMMRKMMLGVKRRAEAYARSQSHV